MNTYAEVYRVIQCLERNDIYTAVFWRTVKTLPDEDPNSDAICCCVIMNDTFGYACADDEELNSTNADAVDKAFADILEVDIVNAIKNQVYWALTLWAARQRKQLPLKEHLEKMSAPVRALFEAIETKP